MANEFYTIEEVCDILSLSAADVKAMVADGRLHELRDAGRIFFRRSEVDKMAAKEGSSIVDLVATDDATTEPSGGQDANSFASALSSLADSSSSLGLGDASPGADEPADLGFADDSPGAAGPGGSSMGLSPMDISPEDFPEELPAAAPQRPTRTPPGKAPAPQPAELTSEIDLLPAGSEESLLSPALDISSPAQVPDLGLSGSSIINLEGPADEAPAAPSRPAAKPAGKGGISVFDEDELDIATDPMGETRIAAGVDELETVGSGSGLLDLTQVSDDTSLGAELLDVISPSQEAADTETEEPVVEAAETVEDSGAITATADDEAAFPATVVGGGAMAAVHAPRVAAYSAMRGGAALNTSMILAILCLAALGLGTAGTLQGVWPDFLSKIARGVMYYSVFGGLAVVSIVAGVLGILADRK